MNETERAQVSALTALANAALAFDEMNGDSLERLVRAAQWYRYASEHADGR